MQSTKTEGSSCENRVEVEGFLVRETGLALHRNAFERLGGPLQAERLLSDRHLTSTFFARMVPTPSACQVSQGRAPRALGTFRQGGV